MMKAKHVRTGINGEKKVAELLKSQGYVVSYPDDNFCGDLIVYCPNKNKKFRIEVKTANPDMNGKFQFCIYRAGHTNCNHADIVVLVFKYKRKTEIRFIDAYYVGHLKTLKIAAIPSEYEGKYSYWWHAEMSDVNA